MLAWGPFLKIPIMTFDFSGPMPYFENKTWDRYLIYFLMLILSSTRLVSFANIEFHSTTSIRKFKQRTQQKQWQYGKIWNYGFLICIPQKPMGVLWISCDRDDRRIFLGLKFPISGFFWLGKFGQVFFWVDLSRDFLGYSKLMFLFFVLYHLMLSGNVCGAEIRHGIFRG